MMLTEKKIWRMFWDIKQEIWVWRIQALHNIRRSKARTKYLKQLTWLAKKTEALEISYYEPQVLRNTS